MEGPIPVSALIHAATLVGEAEFETKKDGTTFREIECRRTKAWVFWRVRDSRKVQEDSGQEPKKRGEKGLGGKGRREEWGTKKNFPEWGVLWRDCGGVKVDGR